MSTTIEQIKQRLSIVEVVQGYLELQKAGGRFRARCPFHNERTPSFYVSPERESFYCFGCNKGGDVFTFVQEIEGVEFKEALSLLAERAGVEIVYSASSQHEKNERERLREVLAYAVFFYHKKLSEHSDVITYLTGRGITKETIKEFRLGYAPPTWRELADYLTTKDVTRADCVASGLVIHKEGTDSYYDRYRNRILFPISDQSGIPIAFSGRIFDQLPGADISQGKYINNPQTALFDKSNALFGFDKAKSAIREKGVCVVVEGQMDVVLSHQAGVKNAVAVSGTALTENHVRTIARLAHTIVFAFDGDDAGIKATERAVLYALNEDLSVKIALMPEGADPADLVVKDPLEWKHVVDSSVHIIDFLVQAVLNRATDDRARRLLAKERILPYIARLKSSIEQAHFVSRIATELGIGEEPVWADLRILRGSKERPTPTQREQTAPKRSRRTTIVRHIVGLRYLLSTNQYDEKLSAILGTKTWSELLETFEREKDALMFELEKKYPTERWDNELQTLIGELEIETTRELLDETLRGIKTHETRGETEKLPKLLARSQELVQTLNELKTKRI
ncbi:MAG: DNA primase [bacterium]|nr:DNA primase [bacterium]